MSNQLTIIGCGSAKPTKSLSPSAQVLEMRDKQFMIDCGEGTQITMQRIGVRQNRLNNIFISHLHGDHCFGLIGLLSTWGMLGRTRDVCIHAQPDLEKLLSPLLSYFCPDLPYDVRFNNINTKRSEVIYEDRTMKVSTLPLKHRVPCCGFLFEEKPREPHIIREMIERYNIPLSDVPRIKSGGDYVCIDGRVIPHEELTRPAAAPYRYAYCSDTAYNEKLLELIEGVDLLYHEATYSNEYEKSAKLYLHSTARQAATIAKKAHVKKLMLGHFSARVNDLGVLLGEAKEVFENTVIAEEKMVYKL